MEESGHLYFYDQESQPFSTISVETFNGHTDKQMVPKIRYKDKTIVFMADLLPSTGHIPLPYVMGYDTRPLLTLEEKGRFLKEAADNNYILFLDHDSVHQCCTVMHTEKGVRLERAFGLSEIL